jgi:eukaryotic-like serine/threonine-protein kinase
VSGMSDPKASSVQQRLSSALSGRYRVERVLGAGGMATVYLAQDHRHDRRVALKVLRPDLAAAMGAGRFLSEIRTTANLQHPHILPLFDSGEADGFLFYVMPYVRGESLRARLDRERQLPVDEAVRIAKAVAGALDYAHRQGIIHRDVKPENVLLHDGEPLVADFGIALAVSAAGGGRLTETGVSIGTPYYMSPEQAAADRHPGPASDVYSLGCVLFEMLVGEPPHTGGSVQAVLAKILTETPRSVAELRRTVPPNVAAAVDRALEQLPADRFATADAFAKALDDPAYPQGSGPPIAKTAASRAAAPAKAGGIRWKSALTYAVPALVVGTVVGVALKPAPVARPAPPIRFLVSGDSLHVPTAVCCGPSMAISPDGARIAYQSLWDGTLSVAVRPLGETATRRIEGTEGAEHLFFSPDGEWLGFHRGTALEKIRVAGGEASTILPNVARLMGATWLPDNTIVFAAAPADGLQRISADGGDVQRITTLDPSRSEGTHTYPHALPGGSKILFVVWTVGVSDRWVELLDLATGERRRILRGNYPMYSATGHMLFAGSDGAVMAQRFDPRSGVTSGGPSRIEDGVVLRTDGMAEYAVSRNGTVVARRGTGLSLAMTLVDRNGSASRLGSVGDIRAPRFSPDGGSIAYEVQGDLTASADQIWLYSLDRHTEQRLTFESDNSWPAWRSDGRAVLFDRDDPADSLVGIYELPADRSGPARRVVARDVAEPHASPDGRWLLWSELRDGTDDIWVRDLESGRERAFLATPFDEVTPVVSPNGNWIAYASTESGEYEVYVQPFPSGGAPFRVSTAGGVEPLWRDDGAELFYRSRHAIVAVEILPGTEFHVGAVTTLFEDRYEIEGAAQNWDVAPGGHTFVMIDGAGGDGSLAVTVNALHEAR